MNDDLRPFFAPRNVALIGASPNPSKLSHGILENMRNYGFTGNIFPVNPQYKEIDGLICYPDIVSVPESVDLAVIVLPGSAVPDVLESGGQKGLKAAIIISGGFREVGPEGAALEARCVEIARRYGMRLIGPNCVGTMDVVTGFNSTFIKGMPEKGVIGFISQSGAVCGGVVDTLIGTGVGFSAFLSLGNEADVNETDMIEYLGLDETTKVIAVYAEAIRDGERFMRIAREVTPKKPVVLLKAGRTSAGARAVSSHTGSLAGSYAAYKAAFRQTGVIEALTVEELFDISMALAHQPLPKGNRVAIITNAGGPAALASDSLAANGFYLEELEATTQIRLREKLVPSAQVSNPVDMLGGAEAEEYAHALECCLQDKNVDSALVILVPQSLVNPVRVAEYIADTCRNSEKPVMVCLVGAASIGDARIFLHRNHIPVFTSPERVGRAIGGMWMYRNWLTGRIHLTSKNPIVVDKRIAQGIIATASNSIGEAQMRPVLAAYGIPVIRGVEARSSEEAVKAALEIGGPVVLKVISPDLLHKSDAGGIRLGLNGKTDIESAYHDMLTKIKSTNPNARIDGVLVEQMATRGQEVIVGMKRDPSFGPVIMFGLGGVLVELVGDVSFRVAPIDASEASSMILETRTGRLLQGYRGEPAMDTDAIVDSILRISQLAIDFPQILELEVNPLLVYPKGQGAVALDARAILG